MHRSRCGCGLQRGSGCYGTASAARPPWQEESGAWAKDVNVRTFRMETDFISSAPFSSLPYALRNPSGRMQIPEELFTCLIGASAGRTALSEYMNFYKDNRPVQVSPAAFITGRTATVLGAQYPGALGLSSPLHSAYLAS